MVFFHLTECAALANVAGMPLTAERLSKLQLWYEAALSLKHWKEKESKLRDEIAKEFFSSSQDSGTETIEIQNGFELKLARTLDYKLNNKENQVEAIEAALLPEAAKVLIKWKPEISVTAYKQSDKSTQDLFNGCLTITPSKPTLEVVFPKDQR